MTVVSTVEWLQAAINAERIEGVDRRVAELEAALVGEIRQLRRELSAFRRQIENKGA